MTRAVEDNLRRAVQAALAQDATLQDLQYLLNQAAADALDGGMSPLAISAAFNRKQAA